MSASGSANVGRGGNSNHRNAEGGGGGRDVKGKGRARGGGGGRGRGGVRRAADYTPAQEPRVAQEAIAEASRVAIEKAQREREQEAAALGVDGEEEEVDTCYICAEPIKYYALGTCSHRTCHVCSLRLRALYKKRECTFCKVCLSDYYLDLHLTSRQSCMTRMELQLTHIHLACGTLDRLTVCDNDLRLLNTVRRLPARCFPIFRCSTGNRIRNEPDDGGYACLIALQLSATELRLSWDWMG